MLETYARVLPPGLRRGTAERVGLRELRLRLNEKAELVLEGGWEVLDYVVTRTDLSYILNAASRYSPWASKTMEEGYLTIEGGHRIGLGGSFACTDAGAMRLREVTSLCLRIARDVTGIAEPYADLTGSILIIGAPGWGKTTLLRDLARQVSRKETTVVIDDRGELFPTGFARGKRMDVLSRCPKEAGMDMALRTLTPQTIVVDEVTRLRDSTLLTRSAHCGVRLLATAHAVSVEDLQSRESYRTMLQQKLFDHVLVLGKHRTVERRTL